MASECRKRKAACLLLILVFSGILTSCSTTLSLLLHNEREKCRASPAYIYIGTIEIGRAMYHSIFVSSPESEIRDRVYIFALALIDLPLSATVDTLILPATIPIEYKRWKGCRDISSAGFDSFLSQLH